MSGLKVAILGSRGIPNRYGGFEQLAERLSEGLSQRGHEVSVYCSSRHPDKLKTWKGAKLIRVPDPEGWMGSAGQFIYDLCCNLHSHSAGFDVVLHLGYTSDSIWHFLWPSSAKHLVNMDGLEWKRSKYSERAKSFLKVAEKLAAHHADALISDSLGIQDYLKKKYQRDSTFIAYGADVVEHDLESSIVTHMGLVPNEYLLAIARFEPENNLKMLIQGFLASGSEKKLALVGGWQNTAFGRYLKQEHDNTRISFLGSVYNQEDIAQLRQHAFLYFHGHSVGGTNPSLVEAMASGCLICSHQNTFNENVLNEHAFYFSSASDIAAILGMDVEQHRESWVESNKRKVIERYSWDRIITQYDSLISSVHGQ